MAEASWSRNGREAGRPAWSRTDTLVAVAVALLAGAVRLARVADPREVIFDETYYAKDACFYAGGPASLCETASEQTAVHPPLGKWLIAAGVRWLGYNSFGWRIASVVAGTLTVALVYVLARKLLGSTTGAAVASGLLSFDLLHFVQSRTAMLDIFVPLFGVVAFLFVVMDRDRISKGTGGGRPWRLAAGVAAGAATASKWSGVLYLVAVLGVSLVWEVAARRSGDRPVAGALRSEWPSLVGYLVVVPALVYAATYAGRLDGALFAAPWSEGSWLRAFVERQVFMADFHLGLDATHSYQSPPWSWILLKRPVSYYFDTAPNGDYKEIFAAGSPLAWWVSIAALLFVFVRWVTTRDPARPEGVILAGFVFNLAPWLVPFTDRPAVFLFYLLPAAPFMYLALGYAARELGESPAARASIALFAAATIGLFGFYYPLTANVAIPYEDWDARLWIFDNCDKPRGVPVTSSITTTVDGAETTTEEVTNSSDDLPPSGWCWR